MGDGVLGQGRSYLDPNEREIKTKRALCNPGRAEPWPSEFPGPATPAEPGRSQLGVSLRPDHPVPPRPWAPPRPPLQVSGGTSAFDLPPNPRSPEFGADNPQERN
ncbi:hypothetical protein P7K49_002020 [Saguinus oedipus]|uniref:Uncharacterized protein n=1 Tax=Saguinus oedipus TaxID=9490 RepID=A0ABQ9WG71_SAGOE|nr:hypothetical protein P7K49_002020 [Saguinus oedipus]